MTSAHRSPITRRSRHSAAISRRDLLRGVGGASLALPFVALGRGTSAAKPTLTAVPEPVADTGVYDAYVPTETKSGQFFSYTCEFDAAWAVLKTFGHDVNLDEQLAIVGHDTSIEPYYEETADGFVIYGGDVANAFSGDYYTNLLARTRGTAMTDLFKAFDLDIQRVKDRKGIQRALRGGKVIWIKATVDFLPGIPTTWITPDGERYPTVLSNDHAVVVVGYNSDVVVIRDVLGPTSTNGSRPYLYEVRWSTFMASWTMHGRDGLALSPRAEE